MRRLSLILLVILILISINVYAEIVSIQNVEIISNDVFHCQPIFKGDKCLVKIEMDITNTNLISIEPKFKLDFSIPVEIEKQKINNKEFLTALQKKEKGKELSKETNFLSDKKTISKNNKYSFDIWVNENGQFNLTLQLYNGLNFLGDLLLDPHINISINSSYPSYHLVNGLNDIYRNNQFSITNEISGELSDGDNITSFDTIVNHIHKGEIIGILDNLEYDISTGTKPKIINISDNILLAVYSGVNTDGYATTFNILNNGSIIQIDTFEFDMVNGQSPDVININDTDVYSIAYEGVGGDGFVKTINILDNGTIVGEIDVFEYELVDGIDQFLFHINNSVYGIVYAGVTTNGFISTVEILDNGTITKSVIDNFEYDTLDGLTPVAIKLSDEIYMIVYEGDGGDGFVTTVNILNNGTIVGNIDTLEYDLSDGDYPDLISISQDIFAIVHQGVADDGFIDTINVLTNGTIVGLIDRYEYELIDGRTPSIVLVGSNVYAIAYSGENTGGGASFDGFIKTVTILDNGTIENIIISTLEFDEIAGLNPDLIYVNNEIFAVIYEGEAGDGFIKTINISTSDKFNDKAISIYFNHTFNESLFYWIEFTILNPSSENVTIYPYINTTGINKTNKISQIIVDDVTKINIGNLIYNDYDFPFRLFSQSNVNISEVYLIEEQECLANFTESYTIGSCLVNDTYKNTTSYTDLNSCTTQEDTTAEYSCNYCSENINLYTADLTSCNDITLTKNVSSYYSDDNFDTCCTVTNLPTDCNIQNATLYPNSTSLNTCASIDCLYDESPYLKIFDDKIPILCEVNKNTSYNFLTYVKDDANQLLQTNPDRQLIDQFGEYNTFVSENGLVNLYYTSKNLRPDRSILITIEGQNGLFKEELNVTPTYKDPFQIQDRLVWTFENTALIVSIIAILVLLAFFGSILINQIRRNVKGR